VKAFGTLISSHPKMNAADRRRSQLSAVTLKGGLQSQSAAVWRAERLRALVVSSFGKNPARPSGQI